MTPKHPRRYQRLPPDRQPWHFCNITVFDLGIRAKGKVLRDRVAKKPGVPLSSIPSRNLQTIKTKIRQFPCRRFFWRFFPSRPRIEPLTSSRQSTPEQLSRLAIFGRNFYWENLLFVLRSIVDCRGMVIDCLGMVIDCYPIELWEFALRWYRVVCDDLIIGRITLSVIQLCIFFNTYYLYYIFKFRSFSFANEHDWFPINFLSLHLVLERFLSVSSVR